MSEQTLAYPASSVPATPDQDATAASVTKPPAEADKKDGPAENPTQQGPKGLRFDFNDGCRVLLPESDHPWRIRLSDLDTGNILYETTIKAGRVNSSKRYFVRFSSRSGSRMNSC